MSTSLKHSPTSPSVKQASPEKNSQMNHPVKADRGYYDEHHACTPAAAHPFDVQQQQEMTRQQEAEAISSSCSSAFVGGSNTDRSAATNREITLIAHTSSSSSSSDNNFKHALVSRKNSSVTSKKSSYAVNTSHTSASHGPADSPSHAGIVPKNLCKFDSTCKDAFCLSRHTNRVVCPNATCQHPACSFYHQNKLRCALDLRCSNLNCDKSHSVSVLKLQMRHVQDEMQFWMTRDPHNASRCILDNLVHELVRIIRAELNFELHPKLHFPHLYNKDTNQFVSATFGTTDSQYIYLCGLRGHQKRAVEAFFQRGIHLTGTQGVIYLEPTTTQDSCGDDEEANYVASFVVPFRIKYVDSNIHCLLSMQWQQKSKNYLWSFLGGYRMFGDTDPVQTATRELNRETLGELPPHLLRRIEELMRGDDYSFRYKHHGSFYYFVPDFLIPDRLLDRITQHARSLPSKAETIQQWRETYGTDREAFDRAIQEGQVSFSFSVGKQFRWVTYNDVLANSSFSRKHQSSKSDPESIPDDCPFMKNVEPVLGRMTDRKKNKRRLKSIWDAARETKYGLIESPALANGILNLDMSMMSETSELLSDDDDWPSQLSGRQASSHHGDGAERDGSKGNNTGLFSFLVPRSIVARVLVTIGAVSMPVAGVFAWWIMKKNRNAVAIVSGER
mmetsp:Transcript_10043/g.37457  ORF Transcript_10043/g.37457 Transcript_10043/m.37457 type:complete len:673 (+) Transcript_10043:134-2152(+)